MSLLTHVARYFTTTWRESGDSHPEDVALADVRFVSDFVDTFESSLGPFFGSDKELLTVSCKRSSATLKLEIPGGNTTPSSSSSASHQQQLLQSHGSSSWNPWTVGVEGSIGEASIDLGTNDLSLKFQTDDIEIPSARSDIGPVLVGASFDYGEQAAAATLKVGPLATKISLTPSRSVPSAAYPHPAAFLTRYNIVSEFSSFFPGGALSQLPNLRIGVRTSNDPQEAPVVLGCALWPSSNNTAQRWSLAADLSLTSLIHMQCLQCHENSGLLANYLSSARGLPGSRRDELSNVREDDDIRFAGNRRCFTDGFLDVSWWVRAPVGPRLFETSHQWEHYAVKEIDAKIAVAATTTVAQFPTVVSLAAHRNGSLCGGLELALPSLTTKLGALWNPEDKRLKFGFELSC
ncbi:Hypothetical protein, putative [Bodo saltans]|uniref:Uncharacterized protein n=1 Tax=Bodo saltans TaxID=75058 RepID=A0A0S4KKD5_BODSA|nr:Hypothetical protein, putative [Bodo saltans]|eukprot:CUI14859.1 Hypothetical protein, putative [Bodo saltans]